MRLWKNVLVAMVLVGAVGAPVAMAGAKLEINEKSSIDLGFRVQVLGRNSDNFVQADGSWKSGTDWIVRRARFRLKGTVNKHVYIFLQTDLGIPEEGAGRDVRMIDAFINMKYNNWSQFVAGINMAPASRQNLTSSGALMAMDRPGTIYKSLTWGTRALTKIATATLAGTSAALPLAPTAVRDVGLTYFGSGDFGENSHLKVYLGTYNGIQASGEDNARYTARAQYNLWNAEPGYFNSSTYLGKKRTMGFGASYDTQEGVDAVALGQLADYKFYEVDYFLELPFGGGRSALTVEAAYQNLDFGNVPDVDMRRSAGNGYYLQAGYYINKWQPWILYENWKNDWDADDIGSFKQYRIGITYFIEGQNANIKLGYEKMDADAVLPISGSTESSINTITLGFYTTY